MRSTTAWRRHERATRRPASPDAFADALQNARVIVQGLDTLVASGRKE